MWTAIVLASAYHELACNKGELLSDGVDRGLEKHPVLVYGLTAVTVAHLFNWLRPQADPYAWLGLLIDSLKGNTR